MQRSRQKRPNWIPFLASFSVSTLYVRNLKNNFSLFIYVLSQHYKLFGFRPGSQLAPWSKQGSHPVHPSESTCQSSWPVNKKIKSSPTSDLSYCLVSSILITVIWIETRWVGMTNWYWRFSNSFSSIVGKRTLCYAEGHEFDLRRRRHDFTNLDIWHCLTKKEFFPQNGRWRYKVI